MEDRGQTEDREQECGRGVVGEGSVRGRKELGKNERKGKG